MKEIDAHVSNEQVFEVFGGTIRTEKYPTGIRTSWVDKRGLLINPDYTHNLQLVHDDLESRLSNEEWTLYMDTLLDIVDPNKKYDNRNFTTLMRLVKNADAQTCCDAFVQVMKARGG